MPHLPRGNDFSKSKVAIETRGDRESRAYDLQLSRKKAMYANFIIMHRLRFFHKLIILTYTLLISIFIIFMKIFQKLLLSDNFVDGIVYR